MNDIIHTNEYNEICKLLNVVSNLAIIENAPKTRTALIDIIEVFRQIGDYGKPILLESEIEGLNHLFNILQFKGYNVLFTYDELKAKNIYIKKASILWPSIKALDKLLVLKDISFEIEIGDNVSVHLNNEIFVESGLL